MPTTLLRRTLREDRRMTIGFGIGVVALLVVYLPFYATMSEDAEGMESLMATLPDNVVAMFGWEDFLSGAGYLEAMVYNLYAPLIVSALAIVLGNRAIAAPEESGRLDQLLSLPISRRRFLAERFGALVLGVVAVNAVAWALVWAFATGMDMGVDAAHIAAASLGLLLLSLCFGTLALAVGALTGRRGIVLAVSGAVVLAAAFIRILANAGSELMEALRWLSPFHYYLGGDPLRSDFPLGYFAVLLGITVVLAVIAAAGFERRDVGV